MIDFLVLIMIYIGIYSILSISLNFIVGYTGLLSLCHAAFFGIGAYSYAIMTVSFQMNTLLALLLAGLIALIFGFLIGLPTLRLKGDYLAIATLGFGEIVRNIIINWDSFTRGPMGINNIPPLNFFGLIITPYNKFLFLVIVIIFAFLTYFTLSFICRSRFGRALEAIREDEISASSMGIDITKYKITSFSLGAFFAGIAGVLYATYNQSIFPQTFNFMLSVMILCMVVLGGLGNNIASIIGAILILLISEIPRLLGFSSIIPAQFNQIIFGLILVLMMIYRPQGVIGRKKSDFEKILEREVCPKNKLRRGN